MLNLKYLNIKNCKTLVREDFNVPILNNKIANINKILLSIPNLKFLIKKKSTVIICAHLRNPQETKFFNKYSLFKICKLLSILL